MGPFSMKLLLSLLLLTTPLSLSSDDFLSAPLKEEFDDDDFLASKMETTQNDGLVGWSLFKTSDNEDRYVINFTNVSMTEYVRFVSRISKVNFQFDEADLAFPITIIAEEPLSVENILSTMIQTLRSRGFAILENDNYLLITKSKDINQIPTIVSEKGEKPKDNAPIVTRVFRIQNANLASLATILKPMMSQGAMIEVSPQTRQLIITDITTNVDKIATLIQTIDSPHSPLDIDIYRAKHLSVTRLITLMKDLITPFADGNPLILVPQTESNTIFIVSTPRVIERAVELMEDLDVAPSVNQMAPIGDRVFLYRLENKSAEELMESIEHISKELKRTGSQSVKLISSLENVRWIEDSNSLLFIADDETEKKIIDILKTLDTFSTTRNYFIYKIEKGEYEQIERAITQLGKSLEKNVSQRELVDAIQSMRYIKETNSLIFTGSDESIKKIKELLPNIDVAIAQYSPTSHYWLYTPLYLTGKELKEALQDIEDNLSSAGLTDQNLLDTIGSTKWVPSTNTLLFTGTPPSLEHIEAIIKLVDVASGAPTKLFLYQPKYISNDQIEAALDELTDKLDPKNLSDRNLAKAIDNMTWISESQTFLFKSDPATIEKINGFLKDIDNSKEAEAIASTYALYNLKYASGEEVIDHLTKIGQSLPKKDPVQRAVAESISQITYLRENNSLLITGSQKAVESVKALISQFDVQTAKPTALDKTAFFIYKPVHITTGELEEALKNTAKDLKDSGLVDPSLLQSIETMRIVELTNSAIFTGSKESLEKTKEIITAVDTKDFKTGDLGEFAGHTFFIYKVRYLTVSQLMILLNNVTANLKKEGPVENQQLIKVIQTAKEIQETSSILFTGPPPVLQRLAELLKQLDAPEGLGQAEGMREAGTYVIYKPTNIQGPELVDMMKEFLRNLSASGVRDNELFETISNLKFIPRTGYILISGEEKSVEKTRDLLMKFDVPGATGEGVGTLGTNNTSFLIYKLHYHRGQELKDTLKSISQDLSLDPQNNKALLTAINSIQWIQITNSLLATGSPEVLTKVKELIKNIDVPLRQVFIEVLIIQTTISNNQQFGLQWGSKVQYLNRFAGGTSNFPAPSSTSATANQALSTGLSQVSATTPPVPSDIPTPSIGAGGFNLGVIGDLILHKGQSFLSLASLVNALQQDNDSTVLMNPKVIAQDSQQSTIFVGQNIPYTGASIQTIQGGGTQTQANIEYRDVGVNLTITPIMGRNDILTLDISTEITQQVENTTANGAQLQGLQTSRTALNARVHVPNKHFVALSGMLQREETHFKSGIPCLGGLPVIGAIFSENDRFNTRNNIIFFLRPVIIDSVEEFEKITQNQVNLFKEQASKQSVKEEVDEGIGWILDSHDDDCP